VGSLLSHSELKTNVQQIFCRFYDLTPNWYKQAKSRHFYKIQVQSITSSKVPKAYNKRVEVSKLNRTEVCWDVKFIENEKEKNKANNQERDSRIHKNHSRCLVLFLSFFQTLYIAIVFKSASYHLSLKSSQEAEGHVSGVCWDFVMSWSTVNALSIMNTKGHIARKELMSWRIMGNRDRKETETSKLTIILQQKEKKNQQISSFSLKFISK